jgi:H+/Cl- antiporter ClcA
MNIKLLLIGSGLFLFAQIVTWFQLNSQFIWKWSKDNEWVLALVGVPLSFLYIWATKYTVESFGGLLWPARFIGFGIGMLVYAIFVSYFFNEGLTTKTLVSLMLCLVLICIQVFWKN